MKTIKIEHVGSVVLGAIILALFLVPTSYAMKGVLGGDGSLETTSCSDKSSIFPSSLFTKLNKSHNGRVSGFELHISNAEGDCSTMIFSSNAAESSIELDSNKQDIVTLR